MKKHILASSILAAAISTPSLATSVSEDLRWATDYEVEASNFKTYLAERYAALAVFEDKQMNDTEDAQKFAVRGRSSASGQLVTPVALSDFNIEDSAAQAELIHGRKALLYAHEAGGREAAPRSLAIAQVAFDCWAEQVEEGYQEDHISQCRGVFYEYLDAAMVSLPDVDAVTMTQVRVPEEIRAGVMAVVYFELDSATLTDQASDRISNIADTALSFDIDELRIIGHTDRSGARAYNEDLSAERAETVRTALMDAGIETVTIEDVDVAAMGETEPAIKTGDGVVEPLNRRVTISFIGSAAM